MQFLVLDCFITYSPMHVWCLGYKWVWSSTVLTVIHCEKLDHMRLYIWAPHSHCTVCSKEPGSYLGTKLRTASK